MKSHVQLTGLDGDRLPDGLGSHPWKVAWVIGYTESLIDWSEPVPEDLGTSAPKAVEPLVLPQRLALPRVGSCQGRLKACCPEGTRATGGRKPQ